MNIRSPLSGLADSTPSALSLEILYMNRGVACEFNCGTWRYKATVILQKR